MRGERDKNMVTRYCRICREFVEVTGFERDDPVLACGHVKRRAKSDDTISQCAADIESVISTEAQSSGSSVDELRDELLKSILGLKEPDRDNVRHCPICDSLVAVARNRRGQAICGGNLYDNPGCGCVLKPISARMKQV